MNSIIHFLHCSSENIVFNRTLAVHLCEDCGHKVVPEKLFIPLCVCIS
jgi:hypothetical protein